MTTITDNQQAPVTEPSVWDKYRTAVAACDTYDTAQKETLEWLINLAVEQGYSLSKLADVVGYSPTVWQRVLTGTYGAQPTKMVVAAQRYKAVYEARQQSGGLAPFVMTAMARRIWQAADYALIRNQIVNLIGKTQRGKTFAIEEYARQRGATCVRVRCPVAPSPTRLLRKIARAMGSSGAARTLDGCMDYIMDRLTPQHLLVVDEIHQILFQDRWIGVRTVEILREIADESGCGLVLIGTSVWCESLNRDVAWKGVLEQVVKRGITVVLPDKLPVDDLRRIWSHYGLPEPDAEQRKQVVDFANNNGLGLYTKVLANGHTLALKQQADYTWAHFSRALATLNALASGN